MFAKIGWWERLRPTRVNDTYDTKTMNSCTNRGCLRGTWSLTDVHGISWSDNVDSITDITLWNDK